MVVAATGGSFSESSIPPNIMTSTSPGPKVVAVVEWAYLVDCTSSGSVSCMIIHFVTQTINFIMPTSKH